jgi:hypothetical protein
MNKKIQGGPFARRDTVKATGNLCGKKKEAL